MLNLAVALLEVPFPAQTGSSSFTLSVSTLNQPATLKAQFFLHLLPSKRSSSSGQTLQRLATGKPCILNNICHSGIVVHALCSAHHASAWGGWADVHNIPTNTSSARAWPGGLKEARCSKGHREKQDNCRPLATKLCMHVSRLSTHLQCALPVNTLPLLSHILPIYTLALPVLLSS